MRKPELYDFGLSAGDYERLRSYPDTLHKRTMWSFLLTVGSTILLVTCIVDVKMLPLVVIISSVPLLIVAALISAVVEWIAS